MFKKWLSNPNFWLVVIGVIAVLVMAYFTYPLDAQDNVQGLFGCTYTQALPGSTRYIACVIHERTDSEFFNSFAVSRLAETVVIVDNVQNIEMFYDFHNGNAEQGELVFSMDPAYISPSRSRWFMVFRRSGLGVGDIKLSFLLPKDGFENLPALVDTD